MLLQIVTARPPMGLTHHVGRALEHGTFADLLDPAVQDWPVEEAQRFAEVALRCCELRRKDRPDLATVVLPELYRLRALGEDNMQFCNNMSARGGMHSSPFYSNSSYSQPRQDAATDPMLGRPQYNSNVSQNAMPARRSNYN
uniref:RING-type E3 ubiquitin transferase n=1 Tax=Arundo donax TaxID=35708 RepID=A0A0A8ZYY5_ARUDO